MHFEPIVKLEAVEVQTLEEAEDVVFHKYALYPPLILRLVALVVIVLAQLADSVHCPTDRRARLYRYDLRLCEWKERGTGDIKLLKVCLNKSSAIQIGRIRMHASV